MSIVGVVVVQVSIYSSGSREAQRLLFANTESGDLRRYLSCYFDTTTGGKRQSESYTQIALSLGESMTRVVVQVLLSH